MKISTSFKSEYRSQTSELVGLVTSSGEISNFFISHYTENFLKSLGEQEDQISPS